MVYLESDLTLQGFYNGKALELALNPKPQTLNPEPKR